MHHRRCALACLIAAAIVCAGAASAATGPADAAKQTTDPSQPTAGTTAPPEVIVRPVAPEEGTQDPNAPPTGVVPPPIVVPANPPPDTGVAAPPPDTGVAVPPPDTGVAAPPPPPPPPDTGIEALPPPASSPEVEPAPLPDPAGLHGVSDPGWTQFGLLPTARTLREGDLYAHYLGYMGLFGVQYGINGDADIGAGLTFFTIELAAKYAFYQTDWMSIAAFAELSFPFYKGEWPMSDAGLEYMMFMGFGPLFSLWNDTAELDVGLLMIPAMQWHQNQCRPEPADPTHERCSGETFDTDFLVLPHVVGSISLGGLARLMLGFEHLAMTGLDHWTCGGTLDPTTHECSQDWSHENYSRNIPALMIGARIHGQRFVCDIGLHFPLHPDWWGLADWAIFIPTVTFGHLW